MNIRVWILGLLIGLLPFGSCKKDEGDGIESDVSYKNESPVRVKRIVGENKIWGKYELEFHYRPDGLLEEVWRFSDLPYIGVRDTLGRFSIEYDVDYHAFSAIDYVLTIKEDSVAKLQSLYPETIVDTLKVRLRERVLYSSTLSKGFYTEKKCRPPLDVWGEYINLSSQTQIVEKNQAGEPLVIRCYNDVFGLGGDNEKYERTVSKYEFIYTGNDMVEGIVYCPDTYSETSWTELWKLSFSHYSGVLTGVDSDRYKMRRSSNTVVVAEPGKNTTYTLNDYSLAVKMENTEGETATIEYEEGCGNFSDLYATPLDKVLGKVWVK